MNETTVISDLVIYLLGVCILFLVFLTWSMLVDLKQAKAELARLSLERELGGWKDLVESDNESGVE